MFPSYTDRHGIGGMLIVLAIGAAFLALAIAPYVGVALRAAQVIGHA